MFDLTSFLVNATAESVARKLSADLTVGDGNSKARGILTDATDSGVTTPAGTVDYQSLVNLVHSVDPAYRRQPGAAWMMHDSALAEIRNITDDQNRPIFFRDNGDFTGRLLGFDVVVNNDMESFSSTNRPIIFGDMSKFWVRTVNNIEVQRMDEKYADSLQIGFVAMGLFDSRLVDPSAVHYLTIG